jgi:hypothetical protein
MKKLIAMALFLAAGTAFAQGFGAVEYSSRDGVDGTADSNAVKVTIGKQFTESVSGDLSSRFAKEDGTNSNNSTRLEAGVTGTYQLGSGFKFYTRGAVGERYSPSDNFAYYSVEPGVRYSVNNALTVKAGYRFRDAFTSSNNDLTRTYRLGAEYALNKSYSLGVGYDRVRGDSDFNAVNATVGFKF